MPVTVAQGPVAAKTLAWFDRYRRELPWRARPGETADPLVSTSW